MASPLANPDQELLAKVKAAILHACGGLDGFKEEFPFALRQALDEVIDTPRTGRTALAEIDPVEKTYIGLKVENVIRAMLGAPRGLLDLVIDGTDVDVKNTLLDNWMIPPEAIGKVCLLVKSNEETSLCSVGLIVANMSNLTSGGNRDKKRSVSAAGRGAIDWIVYDYPYPKSCWKVIPKPELAQILTTKGGTNRLVRLFELMQGTNISRQVVEGVAAQKDYMKRLRRNGGARDKLASQGIALLSGVFHRDIAERFGYNLEREEFLAIKPATEQETEFLRLRELL